MKLTTYLISVIVIFVFVYLVIVYGMAIVFALPMLTNPNVILDIDNDLSFLWLAPFHLPVEVNIACAVMAGYWTMWYAGIVGTISLVLWIVRKIKN